MTSEIDHPDFPTGVAVIGSDSDTGKMTMLYFDEREVSRNYTVSFEGNEWKWWRNNPNFSQRFTVTIAEDGKTMTSIGEMKRNDEEWQGDLNLTYARLITT